MNMVPTCSARNHILVNDDIASQSNVDDPSTMPIERVLLTSYGMSTGRTTVTQKGSPTDVCTSRSTCKELDCEIVHNNDTDTASNVCHDVHVVQIDATCRLSTHAPAYTHSMLVECLMNTCLRAHLDQGQSRR